MHRIEAEVGGRPLYLFAFVGERRLLLDAGCASTVEEFIAPALRRAGARAAGPRRARSSPTQTSTTRAEPSSSSAQILRSGYLRGARHSAGLRPRGARRAALPGLQSRPTASVPTLMRSPGCGEESGGPVRVDVGWSGGELLELGRRLERADPARPRPLGRPPRGLRRALRRAVQPATASRARSISGSTARRSCARRTRTSTSTSRPRDMIEALAPSELHGCHWPAARGPEVGAFIAETPRLRPAASTISCEPAWLEPLTLEELIARVNRRPRAPWPDEVAPELVYSVHGHAERLVALGAATSERAARRPDRLPDGGVTMRISRLDTVRTERVPQPRSTC